MLLWITLSSLFFIGLAFTELQALKERHPPESGKGKKAQEVKDLQRLLFEFAKQADHLTQELLSVPVTHTDIETIFALQAELRLIARKAESVASMVGQIKQVK